MTELLSLPDDVLGHIVLELLRDRSTIRPDKKWCRISGTCRRMWSFHLPPTSHPVSICPERYSLKEDGIQWYLRRLRSAKSLAISVGNEGWSTNDFADFMQSGRVGQFQTFQALQVLGIHFRDSNEEMYFLPRTMALVQGAPYLTALTLHLRTLHTIDLLSSSRLKHLALHISLAEPWPQTFPDLKACPMLESLKLVLKSADGYFNEVSYAHQPDICLTHMPKLRHFELEEQAFPRHKLDLPEECKLLRKLHGYQTEASWGSCLESMSHLPKVMCLGMGALNEWPAILVNSTLELLVLEIASTSETYTPLFDLALLKSIPHVRLISRSFLTLTLTGVSPELEESWKSFEIISERAFWVNFADIDAFVKHTKLFSFTYSYVDVRALATRPHRRMCAQMVDQLAATCGNQGVECYKTSHKVGGWGMLMRVTRISNTKLKPPFDTQEVLRPSEHALWQLARPNMLAPYEDFWPQDPCKSLNGIHY